MAAILALGPVVFGVQTLPPVAARRGARYRWASHRPIGGAPVREFLGPGDDSMTLDVTIGAGLGRRLAVDALRLLAARGEPHILADASGRLYGWWVVVGVRDQMRRLSRDFAPLRSGVQIELLRSDPGLPASIPTLLQGLLP